MFLTKPISVHAEIAKTWFFSKVLILAPVFSFREDHKFASDPVSTDYMTHSSYFISGNHTICHWKKDDRLFSVFIAMTLSL